MYSWTVLLGEYFFGTILYAAVFLMSRVCNIFSVISICWAAFGDCELSSLNSFKGRWSSRVWNRWFPTSFFCCFLGVMSSSEWLFNSICKESLYSVVYEFSRFCSCAYKNGLTEDCSLTAVFLFLSSLLRILLMIFLLCSKLIWCSWSSGLSIVRDGSSILSALLCSRFIVSLRPEF